jgi:hypothetical protein
MYFSLYNYVYGAAFATSSKVGIGNALGGFSDALQDCFIQNRQLVINSRILEKFCEILECTIHQVTEADRSSFHLLSCEHILVLIYEFLFI